MPSIAIVGAGPSGLTCGLALARRGIQVTIFEREEDHTTAPRFNPDRSYTIDITGHGLKAVRYCDAIERMDRELIQFKGIKVRGSNKTDEWTDKGWTGSRGDICRCLQAEIQQKHPSLVEFKFETEVTAVSMFEGKLTTATGHEMTYNLIIGCDGAGSLTRRALQEVPGFEVENLQAQNYCTMLQLDCDTVNELDARYLQVFNIDPFVVAGAINGEEGPSKPMWFCMIGFSTQTKFESTADARIL